MRRTWTIIAVADVARSFAWYQTLLGLPKTAPAHDDFGQILDADGTVLLCLHQWGIHGHPPLTRPDPPPGNGLLLFFRVDDFEEALPRARALVSQLEEETTSEPEHGNDGVRPSGSGWLLRDAQRRLGLKCRASQDTLPSVHAVCDPIGVSCVPPAPTPRPALLGLEGLSREDHLNQICE